MAPVNRVWHRAHPFPPAGRAGLHRPPAPRGSARQALRLVLLLLTIVAVCLGLSYLAHARLAVRQPPAPAEPLEHLWDGRLW